MTNAKVNSRRRKDIFLSIVIPSYNSEKCISQCLASLRQQTQRDDVEVIVVDSSPEDISDFIHEKFPFVRVTHLNERTFPGTARTVGIAKAHGSRIAFIDTDCRAGDSWVDRIIAAHKNDKNVVGGSVANGTPRSLVGTAEYLIEFNEHIPAMPVGHVRFIPTCNISFKRGVFEKIGKLEDTIKGSDTLFCRRILLSGESIYFDRDITVWHINRTSLEKYLRNQYDLGFGGAQVRTMVEDQVGDILVHMPILIPFIPAARTLLIGRRLFKHDKRLFLQFLGLYPLVFLGLVAYSKGFWDGLKAVKKETREESK